MGLQTHGVWLGDDLGFDGFISHVPQNGTSLDPKPITHIFPNSILGMRAKNGNMLYCGTSPVPIIYNKNVGDALMGMDELLYTHCTQPCHIERSLSVIERSQEHMAKIWPSHMHICTFPTKKILGKCFWSMGIVYIQCVLCFGHPKMPHARFHVHMRQWSLCTQY